ncbi:hypothetical protein I4U23_015672 [Adineta vaga]|nr:hypothetical protein I4U23_015672 [Adineta vaga]
MNTEAEEDQSSTFFTKAAEHLIHEHDGRHAEWVLFRRGSLFVQTMENNEETPVDKLIDRAKESLEDVTIIPGSSYGDATVYKYDYENRRSSYVSVNSFPGVILVDPAEEGLNDISAMFRGRENVLNDQQDPVVIATGNTKQKSS